MRYRLPNFMIVGAAKSGTTSLYHYLNQHPDIFLSEPKEPKFISSQFINYPFNGKGDEIVEKYAIKSFEQYQNLFADIPTNIKAIGEASADNLYYSEKAIPLIKKYLGDPKIVIVLRNPVERAFSSYTHLLRENRENLPFEESLKNEDFRITDNYEFLWHFTKAGLYYNQVKDFFDSFSNVKVILFEELVNDIENTIVSLLEYLGVDNQIHLEAEKVFNKSGKPRSHLLQKFIKHPPKFLISVGRFVLGKSMGQKLYQGLVDYNLEKIKMSPQINTKLQDIFRLDIENLEKLINKDLSAWKKM